MRTRWRGRKRRMRRRRRDRACANVKEQSMFRIFYFFLHFFPPATVRQKVMAHMASAYGMLESAMLESSMLELFSALATATGQPNTRWDPQHKDCPEKQKA